VPVTPTTQLGDSQAAPMALACWSRLVRFMGGALE
jgi:hypothetical protein